jgi:hypothetical protein
MLKRHIAIRVFVVYIDTGSPVSNIPSKSRDLVDENFDRMEMIRNNRIVTSHNEINVFISLGEITIYLPLGNLSISQHLESKY